MISYFQSILLGLIQGITELFPISSLGHSVLIAYLLNWHSVLNSEAKSESFFLSFLVILHVATALALLLFYRNTWYKIIRGIIRSFKTRSLHQDPDAKLGWLLIAATIPAGIFALLFESLLRTQFAKPLAAMIFLIINGCILIVGDNAARRQQVKRQRQPVKQQSTAQAAAHQLTLKRAGVIGVAQIGALFAGISRSGITMTAGLYSGLDYEDAARFSFLLATPIILAAGLLKLPDFFSSADTGVRGPILAGGVAAALAAYIAVRYLDNYFKDKTLRPFGIYCILAGVALILLGLFRGHF
jgi:undecaprenyl-diphosphatase